MSKNIDLRKIQIYLISLPDDEDRRNSFLSWCSELGFMEPRIVPGIRADLYHVGLAEAYYNALSIGIESGEPFIIMEDDSTPNYEDENYIISIPDDSDAIYLGGSEQGFSHDNPEVHAQGGAEFELVPGHESTFKVLNMLTTHSILYINKDYAEKVKDECWKCFNESTIPLDLSFAYNLQEKNNVYFIKPFFYQNDLKKYWVIDTTKNLNALNHLVAQEDTAE